ncbi:MAG TPA: ComEC/Rec2 family competence protein [Candidatus Saccharimonadales bacterium]|nr:ComEC/Rec2 family competence protein [Candidatus Saccharimonadales bacterium]
MKTTIHQTTLITAASLAFLIGLVIGRPMFVSGALVVGLFAITLVLGRSRWRNLAIIIMALTLGLWRAGQVRWSDQILASHFGQSVRLEGVVRDDPALNDQNQLSFSLATSRLDDRPYRTNIAVFTHRLPIRRGYQIALVGKLKPSIGANQAEFSFPQTQIISDHISWLERWRLRFFAAERAMIPEPLASFALGLLIGARALIPKTLQAQLAAVGLSHLVAVSGYNLTILVDGVRRVFRNSSKFFVLALSLWLIGGFVAVAGASASIVRAGAVSILVLAAGYYGRTIKPVLLIALVAALTAGLNPHALYSDLGWQLSFAAFAGILIVAPILGERLGLSNHPLGMIALEALAAYLLTLPLILHSFGTFTPIAPLTNLIVMPLVPIAMLASFVAGLAGLAVPLVGGWLAWPAILLLRFIVGVIETGSKLHPLTVQVSIGFMIAWYGLIIGWLAAIWPKRPTPPTWYNDINREADHVRTQQMA